MSARWVTAEVLAALAARGLGAGAQFTAAELDAWTTLAPTQRVHATTLLCALGFVRHRIEQLRAGVPERADVYTLTPDGAAAVAAAAQGRARKSGPKAAHGKGRTLQPHSVSARLWALLRVRRKLDSESAAATLCDAGQDYARMRATIAKTLRRWAAAGAVQESARRVGAQGTSNGFKSYVLVVDALQPPRWYQGSRGAAR